MSPGLPAISSGALASSDESATCSSSSPLFTCTAGRTSRSRPSSSSLNRKSSSCLAASMRAAPVGGAVVAKLVERVAWRPSLEECAEASWSRAKKQPAQLVSFGSALCALAYIIEKLLPCSPDSRSRHKNKEVRRELFHGDASFFRSESSQMTRNTMIERFFDRTRAQACRVARTSAMSNMSAMVCQLHLTSGSALLRTVSSLR